MNISTLRIGGEGGDGVISCGEILTKASARSGYHVFTFRTYPAEIRGGLAMFQLRVGAEPVLSAGDRLDLLVAFNQEAVDGYMKELRPGGILLYDPKDCAELGPLGKRKAYEVPLTEICMKATESKRGKNIVAVGVLAKILGLPLDTMAKQVKEQFAKKGEKVVGANILALVAGYSFASDDLDLRHSSKPPEKHGNSRDKRMVLSGNQAIALGALSAGIRFCAGYPITPATPIFEMLARELPRFDGTIIQCEDEISAIGACLGASYSGVKSLTPTSGPGMALMGEFINLASMAELPIIIVDVQRSGPSTGMPTKSEQGDLNFAVHGTPGDASRVVLAPANVAECFEMTIIAANIAERYQTPVILMSDASLAYRTESVRRKLGKLALWERQQWQKEVQEVENGDSYQRYALTNTGISPIATPGTDEGYYQATGLEHDEYGHPNYSPRYHVAMQTKRHHKLERIERNLGKRAYDKYIPEGARIGVVSWGSTKGAVREAILLAEHENLKMAHFHPRILCPLPKSALKDFFSDMDVVIVVEENFSGQLAKLIGSQMNVDTMSLTKFQGIPFTPIEIFKALKQMVKKQ